jgi:hypothetical protein
LSSASKYFSPWGARGTYSVQEQCELPIGHFGPIDKKLRHIDTMLRPLVIRTVIAAHEKRATGYTDHVAAVFGLSEQPDTRRR